MFEDGGGGGLEREPALVVVIALKSANSPDLHLDILVPQIFAGGVGLAGDLSEGGGIVLRVTEDTSEIDRVFIITGTESGAMYVNDGSSFDGAFQWG